MTREKIYNNFFVKPLYRKVKEDITNDTITTSKRKVSSNKNNGDIAIEIDKSFNLVGDGINLENTVRTSHFNKQYKTKYLPGTCELSDYNVKRNSDVVFTKYTVSKNVVKRSDLNKMLSIDENQAVGTKENQIEERNKKGEEKQGTRSEDRKNKQAENKDNTIVIHEIPDRWLRVYPAKASRHENVCSIIFRCVCCQLGLFSFLCIWTLIFVMAIHAIEGPYETAVGEEFEAAQNNLIVELATELRQTDHFSDKWYETVEKLIRKERLLAIEAVKKGARMHAGTFWDIAGTFLFCIYVMTALGFGAPVPQTGYGRACSLAYAAVSVPMHIYLMVNLSSCVVHQVEKCYAITKTYLKRKHKPAGPGLPCDLAIVENSPPVTKARNVIMEIVKIICVWRCVPLATFIYYVIGVVIFGVARQKPAFSAVMFPLEFTTTGGLEHVEDITRFVYGIYIEGAMTLLSCGLATLRRHSGSAVTTMTGKFRLFKSEWCKKCAPEVIKA